jgi:hypothetical protein
MKITATKVSMDSATERIIAKTMRALTKLPIGISHGLSEFLSGLRIGSTIQICLANPKLF